MGLAFKAMQKFQNAQISTAFQPPTANIRKGEIKDPVLGHIHTKGQVHISLRIGTLAIVPIKYLFSLLVRLNRRFLLSLPSHQP